MAAASIQGLSPEDRAIMRMLVDRINRRSNSLAEISRTTGISFSRLARLAKLSELRYRNRRASPRQIDAAVQAVTDEGLTFRAAANRHRMSKTAVHRFVQRLRNAAVDRAGDLIVKRSQSWRCPIHGLVQVYPCVACAAMCGDVRRGTAKGQARQSTGGEHPTDNRQSCLTGKSKCEEELM